MRLLDPDGKIVVNVGSKSFGCDLVEAGQITPVMARDQKVNNCRWRNGPFFIFGMLTRNGLLAGDVYVTKEDSFFPMNELDRRNMKVMLTASSRVIN